MAKVLLVGKVFLFRHQLDLEPDILEALRRICVFVSTIYVKYWNHASSKFDAPLNDLSFLQNLRLYKEHDDEVAQIAIDSFCDHLWYLGSELVTLALFSSHVPTAIKNKMRRQYHPNESARDNLSLRFQLDDTTMNFDSLSLEDFVRPRSYFLFQLFEMTPDFLHHDAFTWENITSYVIIKNMIDQSITVVNDGAERILGMAEKSIKTQRARKENNFRNLLFSKFDRNSR